MLNPHTRTVVELIHNWIDIAPIETALIQRDHNLRLEISREELGIAVRDLAVKLNELVPHGRLVVIAGHHRTTTVETIVALLACLEARLDFVLCEHSNVPGILEQTSVAAIVAADHNRGEPRAWTNLEVRLVCSSPTSPLSSKKDFADYVVFSSGTTGKPKGIIGSGEGLNEFINWQTGAFGITDGDRCACLTPPTFDVFLRDVLTPLSAGATLVLPSEEDCLNPARLFLDEDITLCHAVPSLTMRWLRRAHGCSQSLRLVFFAGEPLFSRQISELRAFAPHARVINLYGPSETTLAKFYFDATKWSGLGVCPVGNPLPGTQYKLYEGEVHISPSFELGGYLNRQDPAFYQEGGRWWFATGDLGKQTDLGLLVEGRTDQQIKVAGVRVNVNEVAAALAGCEGVENATVLPVIDNLGTHMVAFAQSTTRTPSELLGDLVDLLPTTHLPTRLLVLAELPVNARGKIDRHSLRKILREDSDEPHGSHAAWNPLRGHVCDLAGQALGTAIDPSDDFFAAGGTSLEAAMWSAKLAATGLNVSLRSLFELRTPHAVAEFLTTAPMREDSGNDLYSTRRDAQKYQDFSGELPITARQRRYARVYLPNGNRNWANMTTAVPLPPQLNEDPEQALQVAAHTVSALVSRHDSLRCTIDTNLGVQHFRSAQDCMLPPLEHLTQSEWEQVLSKPIPVEQYPPHRWALVDGELRWVIHHLFCDGHSQSVLRKEAKDLLQGKKLATPTSLSYAEFTQLEPHETSRKWWQLQLAHPPQLPILMDSTRNESGAWKAVCSIPKRLIECSHISGITPFQGVMLGMFSALMERTGRDDFFIGTPGLGRTIKGVEDTVGNFISLVLVRLRAAEVTPAILQDRLLGALENQDYQYDQIMDDMGQPTSEDRFPITGFFASHMVLDSSPVLGVSPMEVDVKFDAMAYVLRNGSDYFLEIQARRSIFGDQEMVDLLNDVLKHWENQC